MTAPATAVRTALDLGGWREVADIGKVRRRKLASGRYGWRIDFYPHLKGGDRYLTSDRGERFDSEEHAERVRGWIQGKISPQCPIQAAVDDHRQSRHKRHLIRTHLEQWVEEMAEEHEPYTVSGYRTLLNRHTGYWDGRGIHEIDPLSLKEWERELAAKGLSSKTRRNMLGYFQAFCGWEARRNRRFVPPPPQAWPRVKWKRVRERKRLGVGGLVSVLAQIAPEDRGLFLAMAYWTIRNGEARAVQIRDLDLERGECWIGRAIKGHGSAAPSGRSKTGEPGNYPVPDDLRAWIGEWADLTRAPDAPLFANPRTGRAYSQATLNTLWNAACKAANIEHVDLYIGTKHSGFTALSDLGLGIDEIMAMGRHTSARTSQLYVLERDRRRVRGVAALAKVIGDGSQTGPKGEGSE